MVSMTDTTALFGPHLHLGEPLVAGALQVYPLVRPTGSAAGAPTGYLPSPLALGDFEVVEVDGGGSVPDLHVTNKAGKPLLLVEGETLVGGLQNRTLNVTVLVPVGVTTRVPVSCVEAGRWGAHREASRSVRHSPTQLRANKTASVNRSMRSSGSRRSDQGAVWDDVASYAADHEVASPSQALEDVHASAAPRVESVVDSLRPRSDQLGVVVAVAGEPVALELFDDPDTLAAYWDGLVRGYALDAVQADATKATDPSSALRFLRSVAGATATEGPGVGLGNELHLESDTVTGTGLRWDGHLRHLATSPPSSAPTRRTRIAAPDVSRPATTLRPVGA